MRAIDRRSSPVLRRRNRHYQVGHRLSLARDVPENPNPVPDDELTGEHIVEAFKNPALGTGGRTPYHALIDVYGHVHQMLRLSVCGSHARGYNWRSLAWACAGNMDERPLNELQVGALVRVVRDWLPLVPELVGHTDLPGASDDPNKRCPGRFLYLRAVEASALALLPDDWRSWDTARRREHALRGGWEL